MEMHTHDDEDHGAPGAAAAPVIASVDDAATAPVIAAVADVASTITPREGDNTAPVFYINTGFYVASSGPPPVVYLSTLHDMIRAVKVLHCAVDNIIACFVPPGLDVGTDVDAMTCHSECKQVHARSTYWLNIAFVDPDDAAIYHKRHGRRTMHVVRRADVDALPPASDA